MFISLKKSSVAYIYFKMNLKLFINLKKFQYKFIRSFSNNNVLVDIVKQTAILRLSRPPVNGLNLEVLHEFQNCLSKLEKKSIKGLIITSNKEGILTGGIDISELQTTDQRKMKKYWKAFRDTYMQLFKTPLLTVAAINGHSPAGGCIFSIACDYRVMTKNYVIGGNETQLGLIPPVWFIERMADLIGHRKAELAFTQGKLFTTKEAYEIGLIDEIVETTAEGLSKAQHIINSHSFLPKKAREISKMFSRQPYLDRMIQKFDDDMLQFVQHISDHNTQRLLEDYMKQLKDKKKCNTFLFK